MGEDLRLVHKELRTINMTNTKNSLYSFDKEAVSVAMLGRNFKLLKSKFDTEITMSGFPQMEPSDEDGEPVSFGTLSEFSISIELEKESAVFEIKDLDYKSLSNVQTIQNVVDGLQDVAMDTYINQLSWIFNNLHNGVIRTHNGEIPLLENRGPNSIWSAKQADGTYKNLAENFGSNAFSVEGIKAAKKAIRTHMTPYMTRVKSNIIGAIVDRRAYDDAADIVASRQIGDDLTERVSSYNLPLGVLDFNNEQDWSMLTDKHTIGAAYLQGFMFPQIRVNVRGLSNNVDYISEHYFDAFCSFPTGFYFNKF